MDLSLYRNILDNLFDAVYLVDRERGIQYWNKAAERISGYRADEVIGHYCWDNLLMHVDDKGENLCQGLCPLAAAMQQEKDTESDIFLHHKDGHRVPVHVRVTPLRDEHGKVIGAAEIFSDNSPRLALLQQVKELEKLAMHDPLTGLGNRRFTEMQLNSRLDEMHRYGWFFGIFYLDVDHFKHINDTYGHDVGDRALQMVAKTMQNSVRSFDLVGRWGGEEFLGIIVGVNPYQLFALANKMRGLISQSSFTYFNDVIQVTASIGATVAQATDSPETLVKRADSLMYQAKGNGRNRVSMDPGTP
jgi:diguanylate cyclase (GGDEF)-like protein/PAS domain S-box-containing protein